ncbi:MAG: NAD-dependent epimerase/dehydratase family protein [Gemmatimonadales bacterium]
MTAEIELEAALAEPTPELVADLAHLPGDFVVLGASGKMGPSLVRLLVRALDTAGIRRRVFGVARYGAGAEPEFPGAEVIRADLLDPAAVRALPMAANVIYLVGQKFGTSTDPARTWAVNTAIPAFVAERYRGARIVVFSTGNVYPLTEPSAGGPTETDPTGPVGEYAQSALARERVFTFYGERDRTPVAILRLNYAIEPRYGVLRDIGDRVFAGETVDLAMGHVNVIWQRDANAAAVRALRHAGTPPFVVNLTGPFRTVRSIAEAFGRRFGKPARFIGREAATALIANTARCEAVFGPPVVGIEAMVDRVAEWIVAGGRSLGKPTHFTDREGRF